MHLGLGYSRVTGGCQWAEYIASPSRPSLINKLRHMYMYIRTTTRTRAEAQGRRPDEYEIRKYQALQPQTPVCIEVELGCLTSSTAVRTGKGTQRKPAWTLSRLSEA